MKNVAPPEQTKSPHPGSPPPLESGDRLSREEFHRRYEAHPEIRKAELVDGVVHVPSPVNDRYHGSPHLRLAAWLGTFQAFTPGLGGSLDATVILDPVNEPQPDLFLRLPASLGGRSTLDDEGYVQGPPDLVVEIAASSASYDLHSKKEVYRRTGVKEYIVWRSYDGAVDWFILRDGTYESLTPSPGGILQSVAFPGLWLDPAALLRGDMARVLEVVQAGIGSPAHVEFAERLETAPPGDTAAR